MKHVGGANVSDPKPSVQSESEIQAGLRSRMERKRRLQIRTCCQRLHDLLPFVNGRLDTASTLELTAKYMSYLKQTLSKDMLSKVDKSIEENRKGTWNKKAPKTRKTCRLRRSLTPSPKRSKPVAKKHSDEPYMYRHIQPRNSEAHQLNITVIHPLMNDMETSQFVTPTGIPTRPVLLDESTVPRGQMLPVCQNLCTAPSFKSMENNYKMSPPAFLHPTAGLVTSIMESQMFRPEIKQGPAVAVSSGVPCGMLHSSPVPSRIFNHIPMTPDQSWFVNWTSPNLLTENQTLQASSLNLNETCLQADGLNQHHGPPPPFEDATPSILNSAASLWPDHSEKDDYCDSPPSLSSSCLAMSTLSSNPMTYSPPSFAASIWFDPTKLDTPIKTDVAPNMVLSP